MPGPFLSRGNVPLADLRAWDRATGGKPIPMWGTHAYWCMLDAQLLTDRPHAHCDHRRGICYAT